MITSIIDEIKYLTRIKLFEKKPNKTVETKYTVYMIILWTIRAFIWINASAAQGPLIVGIYFLINLNFKWA